MEMNKLQDKKWNNFILENIFDVSKGIYLHSSKIEKGELTYITAKAVENGVNSFINYTSIFPRNSITIEKVSLKAFFQPTAFYCSHDVSVLYNNRLNKFVGLFISNIISRNGIKYNYGRQAQMNVVKRERILLPSCDDGAPDYAYMEEYSRKLYEQKELLYLNYIQKRFDELKKIPKPIDLEEKNWQTFRVTELFEIMQRGKRLKKDDHSLGNIPYVSSTSLNNGIDGFIGNNDGVRFFINCLTLANSGSVGSTFFQPYKIIASDHVTILKNRQFDKYIYLFLSSMLTRLSEKYSFNREINDTRLSKEKILLPILSDGNPDFEYMRQYMKYKEYKKLKLYLEFKNK